MRGDTMDTSYPGYSAVYSTPNPSTVSCPQCAGIAGPGGFTVLPELASALPQYSMAQQATATQNNNAPTTGSLPPRGRMYFQGYNPNTGLIPQNVSPAGPNTVADTTLPPDAQQLTVPINDLNQPMPMTAESLQYLNGFLRTQIGRRVTVEFLIGTNTLVDRTGILLGVGANYILINETDSDDLLACDYYNIKFVKFYY